MVSHLLDFAIIGAIVTVKLHEAEPTEFVAVQVTVVTPIGKVEPDGGAQVTVAPLVAVGVGYVTTPPVEVVAVTFMLIGQAIVGGGLPDTITRKLQFAEPLAFVAVQVTVVVPTGNVEPDGGTQFTVTPTPVMVGFG